MANFVCTRGSSHTVDDIDMDQRFTYCRDKKKNTKIMVYCIISDVCQVGCTRFAQAVVMQCSLRFVFHF